MGRVLSFGLDRRQHFFFECAKKFKTARRGRRRAVFFLCGLHLAWKKQNRPRAQDANFLQTA